eukprot:Opistho-2@68312
MGFKGLVITDALNMKGVRSGKGVSSGEIDLQAFIAGNDILLYSENIPEGISKIKDAIQSGVILQTEIDNRVKKILHAKYWVGLNRFKYIETNNLYQELHTPEAQQIKQELFENAITVVKDTRKLLPLSTENNKLVSVSLDITSNNHFQQNLTSFTSMPQYS